MDLPQFFIVLAYLTGLMKVLEGVEGKCKEVDASSSPISNFWSSNISNPDPRLSDLGYLTLLWLLKLKI